MATREFMAIGQPNVDLAAWAAAPYGWIARPAPRTELATLGVEGRAVELVHPRSPIAVVIVEDGAADRSGSSSGAFLFLSAGLEDAFRLSTLLRHPAIQQLVSSLGAVSRRSRLEPALSA